MSETIRVNGLGKLRGHLARGQKGIKAAITRAIKSTSQKAIKPIRKRVPVAFGELRDSIQAYSRGTNGSPVTVADAPHAGAVEIGSPPHKPNFERLLAWVKLRGMQGLRKSARTPMGKARMRFGHGVGPTTRSQARRVATMLKQLEVRGRKGVGRHSPADAAVQVARAISKGIEEHGTRPHWFVRQSLPEIRGILDGEIRKELDRATENQNPAMSVKDSELF